MNDPIIHSRHKSPLAKKRVKSRPAKDASDEDEEEEFEEPAYGEFTS
jgi:hypothetical protein